MRNSEATPHPQEPTRGRSVPDSALTRLRALRELSRVRMAEWRRAVAAGEVDPDDIGHQEPIGGWIDESQRRALQAPDE